MKYIIHTIIIGLLVLLIVFYGKLHADTDYDKKCKRAGRYSYQTYRDHAPSWHVQGFGLTTGGQQEEYSGLNAHSYSYANGFNMMPK